MSNDKDGPSVLAERLEKALTARMMKPADLAKSSGVDPGMISRILKSITRFPRTQTIRKLAEALDIDPVVLMDPAASFTLDSRGRLQVLKDRVSSVKTAPVVARFTFKSGARQLDLWNDLQQIHNFTGLPPVLQSCEKGSIMAFTVESDAMAPAILPGDLLFIQKCESCKAGDCVLGLSRNEKPLVRKLRWNDEKGIFYLEATNPDYPGSRHCDLLTLIGKVVGFFRQV